ncbi:helix-turn-helix domain-containing protein [Rhodococcus koreensis]|uniref:Helix-turn-helix domain-containing protein n=1 Tax=Rhodococcus koreensis TaxID=99653 RepID=A0A1H5EZR8_9NOCA|nr:cupin domain-containing protein [Rhodococcus koreensis]SED91682.1 Helix-turn-helix domain-containing protein [Rhodococcus koreensis]SED96589.1 Helix-turn-helix domain-containing protein [Rhodococcus koreensis]
MATDLEPIMDDPAVEPGAADDSLDEVLLSVGQRVRHYRRLHNLTLQDLAAATGLSASMISTVERGQTGVSVATIHSIAQALDVSITALFQAAGPGDPVVKHEDQRRDLTSGGACRTLAITDPDMRLEFYVYDFEPGTASASAPTTHHGVEYGINLSGSISVEIDGREFPLAPGDAVQYSTQVRHLMKNTGDSPAKAVWLNISRL